MTITVWVLSPRAGALDAVGTEGIAGATGAAGILDTEGIAGTLGTLGTEGITGALGTLDTPTSSFSSTAVMNELMPLSTTVNN